MLKRHIQVIADILPLAHHIQHFQRKFGRIGIMQPDPFEPFYVGEPVEQVAQHSFFINVQPVISQFLRNQHHLLHSFFNQPFRFLHQIFHGFADMYSPHQRDGAKRTGAVAAFRNF